MTNKSTPLPTLTAEMINAEIVEERYFTAAAGCAGMRQYAHDVGDDAASILPIPPEFARVTICALLLRNGTKLIGVNAGGLDPTKFSPERGRQMARQSAVDQIWELEGYRVRSERLAKSTAPVKEDGSNAGN